MSVGRPSQGLTEAIIFMTTPEQREALRTAAADHGDVSKVIRKSIAFFLASEVSKSNQSDQQSEPQAA